MKRARVRTFRVEPEADEDLFQAANWYDEQRPGIGWEFLAAMEALLRAVQERPDSFPEEQPGVRAALRRPWPYKVYFQVTEEATRVFAVIHAHRNPYTWRTRLNPPDA